MQLDILIKLLTSMLKKQKHAVAIRYLKQYKDGNEYMQKYLPFMKSANPENIEELLQQARLVINNHVKH